jgi:hypothetical protein
MIVEDLFRDYKNSLSKDEAMEIIKTKCSDAFKNFDTPIWRGMRGEKDCMMVDPLVFGRNHAIRISKKK